PVDTATGPQGQAIFLTLTPPTSKSLNDSEYLLALAPKGFNTAARSYQINVETKQPMLAPASLAKPPAASEFPTPLPSLSGGARLTTPAGELVASQAGQLIPFRAPADGTATVQLTSNDFDPVLSAYDEGGALLAVASRTVPGVVVLSLPVQASAGYVLRV